MRRLTAIITVAAISVGMASAQTSKIETFLTDSLDHTQELLEQLENLPNIEVGKGITFRPKDNSYELTIRFRMQNMVGLYFNDNFSLSETEAQIKRLSVASLFLSCGSTSSLRTCKKHIMRTKPEKLACTTFRARNSRWR